MNILLVSALACLCLAGCAVAEYPYPAAWEPLVPQADSDCRRFEGRYADRGERGDEPTKPSLTRQLFGEFSDWENASSVQLVMPNAGAFEISVTSAQGERFSRTLLKSDNDFACRGGRLILRDRRWIAGYIMSGRQHVQVDLNEAGQKVVAQVEEMAYGVMFVIFPVVGTARHWYRFQRLP
ncbi:MAG: hypothetical protein QOD26_3680 [Betaproteobacteria bacterium]|nr:hypothetical protein [Betaproteobacteria bacterium]